MQRCGIFVLFSLFLYLTAPGAAAQAAPAERASIGAAPIPPTVRTDTPSGLPVPRFVSLKQRRTPCRAGPSLDHPVRYTFLRQGAPVLVIAETTDHWRKIRDIAGDECWAHRMTMRATTHVFVMRETPLLARPKEGALQRAVLGEGALVELEKEKNGWAKLTAAPRRDNDPSADTGRSRKARGWARASALWGVDPISAAAGARKN